MLALFSISCGMYHPPRASVQWVFLIQARPEIEEEEVTLRKCMYRIVFMWLAHLLSIWIAFSYSLPHRMFPVGVIESHTPISSSTRNKGNQKWKVLRGMVWDIGKSRQESSHCWRHSQDLWAGDHCWSVAIPSSNLCPSLRGRERSHPFLRESSCLSLLFLLPWVEQPDLSLLHHSQGGKVLPVMLRNPTTVQESRSALVLIEKHF